MADNLPTVWRAEPHTLAKHAILERYLNAWFPILSRQSGRLQQRTEILFIDGFAGPGEYANGKPGSPTIALTAALRHSVEFPVPIRFLFIEADKNRFDRLQEVLGRYTEEIRQKKNIALSAPCNGECDSILSDLLNNYEKRGTRFGPALAFLDQFGYSAVSMRLVGRLLAFPQCEVFSYLDYKDMNRWITDPSKAVSFDRTWGGDEWRHAIDLPEAERRAFLLDSYKAALKSRAKATYVSSFSMFDGHDRPLYWLIFSTNNLRGLEEMKRAMWSVDKMGSFKFSDNDTPGQLSLLNHGYDQNWLADELSSAFAGQTVTVAEVKEHVLVSTPCYLFREALKILETGRDPVVRVKNAPASRRPGTYPEEHLANIVVRFREAKLF